MGDGTRKIFLNTRGTHSEGVPPELLHFLQYVENSTDECVQECQDETVEKLHRRVTWLKEDRRWEAKYMKFEELLQDKLKEGIQQGVQQGIQQGVQQGIQQGVQQGIQQEYRDCNGCAEGKESRKRTGWKMPCSILRRS